MARHGLEASIVAIAGSEKRLHRRHKAGARAVACVVESLEKRLFLSAGTTYVVNSLADNLPNDGSTITLREAIQAANSNTAVGDAPAGSATATDVIQFDPSLTGGTITLSGTELAITDSVQIIGLGSDRLSINANAASRIFNVTGGTDSISGIHLTNSNGSNAAVYNSTTLSLSNMIIDASHGTTAGGICNAGSLTVSASTIANNTGPAGGYSGGGIYSSGSSLVVDSSLISTNTASEGGGIGIAGGTVYIDNSTIYGNTATNSGGYGGGVRVWWGSVQIVQSTITSNQAAGYGGGVGIGTTVKLNNTVVAGNSAGDGGPDVYGTFDSTGDYNFIGAIDSSSGLGAPHTVYGTAAAPADPELGPLANNGGTSLTQIPWVGSPLLNAGSSNLTLDCTGAALVTDQRGSGFPRIVGGTVDIGAVEGSRAVNFALTNPAGAYYIGQNVPISWDPSAVPLNSTINFYYTNSQGKKTSIGPVAMTAPASGQYSWVPLLPPGSYTISATLTAPDGTQYTSTLTAPITLTAGGVTYDVNSTGDNTNRDGLITLREAVLAATTHLPVGDAPAGSSTYVNVIEFDPSLNNQTIVLTGTKLPIADNLLITGPGAGLLTINANHTSRIFDITVAGVHVGIAGLTLTAGNAITNGGAISNSGTLTLAGVTVTNNAARNDGGGIFNSGTLFINDSLITQNTTNGSSSPDGAGIYNQGNLSLDNVQVTQNAAYGNGGGIVNSAGSLAANALTVSLNTSFVNAGGVYDIGGTVNLSNSTVSANTGYFGGGGMWVTSGSPVLSNDIFSQNTVVTGNGGGLLIQTPGTTSLSGCTFTGNSTPTNGGGLYIASGSGVVTVTNGLFSGNSATSGGGLWTQAGTNVSNSTFTANSATSGGGGIYQCPYAGTLTLTDSSVTNNNVTGSSVYGGGICGSSVVLTRSQVSGNQITGSSAASGGGIYEAGSWYYNLALIMTDSTVANNSASGASSGYGGGCYISESAFDYLTRCTISGNSVYGASVSQGGGVDSQSALYVIDSTVSGNRAYGSSSAGGGGLFAASTTYIRQSTMTLNQAEYGGGVYQSSGAVQVQNSIVAGNSAEFGGTDVYGAFDPSSGYDLVGVIDGSTGLDSAPGVQFGTAASPLSDGLAALADNGGSSSTYPVPHPFTHAPMTGSAAINAGSISLALDQNGNPITTDQTGEPLVVNAMVNIGAIGNYKGSVTPSFHLTAGPSGAINAGTPQTISWNQAGISATSLISIYANAVAGGAVYTLLNSANPNVLAGSWVWHSVDVPAGAYTISAQVQDQVDQQVSTAQLPGTVTVSYANAYVVNSLADTLPNNGSTITLREAIQAANTNAAVGDAHAGSANAVDVITFAPSLTSGTITLTGGSLPITGDLCIQGLGSSVLTIAGDQIHDVFSIVASVNAWISGLTIRNGASSMNGGGITNAGNLGLSNMAITSNLASNFGGGIYNTGQLTIANCTFSGNTVNGSSSSVGGALYNLGTVNVSNTSFINNISEGSGAGIANVGNATLTSDTLNQDVAYACGGALFNSQWAYLQNCNFTGDSANANGGAIYSPSGVTEIWATTLTANIAAGSGGAIYDGSNGTLSLNGSTVSNNTAAGSGGGIWTQAAATLTNGCVVSGNTATSGGGGIYQCPYAGTLTLTDSSVTNNNVTGSSVYGGGICSEYGTSVVLTRSQVSGNQITGSSAASGGGIYEVGGSSSLIVTDSTIANNSASGASSGCGGGLALGSYYDWTCTVTRCTISGNSVYGGSTSQGGGVYAHSYFNSCPIYVIDSTVSGNRAYGSSTAGGGGIFATGNYGTYIRQSTITLNQAEYGGGVDQDSGSVQLQNSIVAANTAEFSGADVYGTFDSSSAYNLIGVADGSTGLTTDPHTLFGTGTNPLDADLGALADNGGYASTSPVAHPLTHALLAGSPAINAGSNILTLDQNGKPITIDERWALRIQGGIVDIGAFEGPVTAAFHITGGPTGAINVGAPQTISWTSQSIPATSLISIYADPDGIINGNEIWLLQDANPNTLVGTWTWNLVNVPAGTYTIGAQVVDQATGLASVDRMPASFTVSYANAYVVNSLADTLPNDGSTVTLREAIEAANTNQAVGDAHAGSANAVDVITFAPSLTGGTIVLTGGALPITDNLCIQGLGSQNLTINGGGSSRIFKVSSGIETWLSGLTLTNASTTSDGGAINNAGSMTASDLKFTNNKAYDDGAGIFSTGSLTGSNLTFTANSVSGSADPSGGAVYASGSLSLSNSTFQNNQTAGDGGALYVAGFTNVSLAGVTISGNSAANGGGIYTNGVLTVTNITAPTVISSISDNYTIGGGSGGGVCKSAGTASFYSTTLSGNTSAGIGGGIYDGSNGTLLLNGSTVSNNSAASNGGGIYTDATTLLVNGCAVSGNTATSDGGGIFQYDDVLAVTDSSVTNDSVTGSSAYGGGIYDYVGSLTLTRSQVSANKLTGASTAAGGGIWDYDGSLTATDSTVANNGVSGASSGYGGGLDSFYATYTLTRCTVSNNSVYGGSISQGGGIYGYNLYSGGEYVVNSTISGNRAYGSSTAGGGGVFATGSYNWTYIRQSTITLNQAEYGGGVDQDSGSTIQLQNSIVAANTAEFGGTDVYGTFDSSSAYNLIGVIDGSTGLSADPHTQSGTAASPLSPGLTALANNGGYTQTQALLAGSPAIDAGSNVLAIDQNGNGIQTDQRGGTHLRILNGIVDIGAYEGQTQTYFALFSPNGASVAASWSTPITWGGVVPVTSLISIYYDTDGSLDNTATYLVRNQPYWSLNGQYNWQSVLVPTGTYSIGAVVTDPVSNEFWSSNTPLFSLVNPAPTVYVVNTTADNVAVDGKISLREAIEASNSDTAVGDAPAGNATAENIIEFDPSLAGQTISLTSSLPVTSAVNIEGINTGATRVTLNANGQGPVFVVSSGVTASISDLRLTGGVDTGAAGGAIVNGGSLTLNDLEIYNNSALYGGGISNNAGTITASNLWVHDNTATGSGSCGGGIYNVLGTIDLLDSTISNNTALDGGGVCVGTYSTFAASNCTISDNTASGTSAEGGGLYDVNHGSSQLINVTVTANTVTGSSASAGGIYVNGGSVYMVNTIAAGDTAPTDADVQGAFMSTSNYNTIGVIDGSTGLNGAASQFGTAVAPLSAKLGALAMNGGLTPTHAIPPTSGSPAINSGLNAAAVDPNGNVLLFDQRGSGYFRIQNGQVDIGAYECTVSLLVNANTAYIKLDADKLHIDIWNSATATGTPAQTSLISNISNVIYTGPAGGDLFILDCSNGDPLPAGGISLTGGAGQNSLEIVGDTAGNSDTVAINAGSFTMPANAAGAGTLNYRLGTVSIAAGAELALAQSDAQADQTAFTVNNLSVAGTLDITNNTLVATESNVPLSQIATWVQSKTITSSLVSGPHAIASRAVGYGDHSADPITVPAGDVEVKYVPTGDASLDGVVDITDLTRAINDLGRSAGYAGGDVLNQGVVNISDVAAIINDLGARLNAIGDSVGAAVAAVQPSAGESSAATIPVTPAGTTAMISPAGKKPAREAVVLPSAGTPIRALFSDTRIQSDWLEATDQVLAD